MIGITNALRALKPHAAHWWPLPAEPDLSGPFGPDCGAACLAEFEKPGMPLQVSTGFPSDATKNGVGMGIVQIRASHARGLAESSTAARCAQDAQPRRLR